MSDFNTLSGQPPVPPTPPPAKKNDPPIAAIVVGALIVLGLWGLVSADDSSTPTSSYHSSSSSEITADMIVDALAPSDIAQFCGAYATVGDAGYPSFASTYNEVDPSAREVFDELASRC